MFGVHHSDDVPGAGGNAPGFLVLPSRPQNFCLAAQGGVPVQVPIAIRALQTPQVLREHNVWRRLDAPPVACAQQRCNTVQNKSSPLFILFLRLCTSPLIAVLPPAGLAARRGALAPP